MIELSFNGTKQRYVSWRSASDEYVRQYFARIVCLHFSDWMCDRRGMLTLPDYSRPEAWEFARKWQLVENGKVTERGEKWLKWYQPERAVAKVFNAVPIETRKDLV